MKKLIEFTFDEDYLTGVTLSHEVMVFEDDEGNKIYKFVKQQKVMPESELKLMYPRLARTLETMVYQRTITNSMDGRSIEMWEGSPFRSISSPRDDGGSEAC